MPEEQTTIDKKLYYQLLDDRGFLNCLFAVGVVDWEGYDTAVEMANQTGSFENA